MRYSKGDYPDEPRLMNSLKAKSFSGWRQTRKSESSEMLKGFAVFEDGERGPEAKARESSGHQTARKRGLQSYPHSK